MNSNRDIVLHVIGLQRSGTNFISKILELNTNATVLPSGNRSVCWKHSLPWEAGRGHTRSGLSAAEAIKSRPKLRIVLVSKHPLTWWESISARSGGIFLVNRPACRADDGKADLIKCCTFYKLYYGSWLQLIDNKQMWHVRYEDALRDGKAFTSGVAERLGLRMSEAFVEPEEVPYSSRFNPDRRMYYLKTRTNLSEVQSRLVSKTIDHNVLYAMGYHLPGGCGAARSMRTDSDGGASNPAGIDKGLNPLQL